jgi:hypothetical protein
VGLVIILFFVVGYVDLLVCGKCHNIAIFVGPTGNILGIPLPFGNMLPIGTHYGIMLPLGPINFTKKIAFPTNVTLS